MFGVYYRPCLHQAETPLTRFQMNITQAVRSELEQQENAAEYDAFSFIDENTLVCATRAAEPIATDPITRYYEDILDVDGDTLIAVTQAAEQQAENDCKYNQISYMYMYIHVCACRYIWLVKC